MQIDRELSLSIDDYINDAKAALVLDSDRALGRAMKFNGTPVSFWRTKKTLPGEDTMTRLAELGGHDPDIALAHLGAWRNSGPSSIRYRKMAEKLARALGTAGAAIVALLAVPGFAEAAMLAGQVANRVTSSGISLYIMANKIMANVYNGIRRYFSEIYKQINLLTSQAVRVILALPWISKITF